MGDYLLSYISSYINALGYFVALKNGKRTLGFLLVNTLLISSSKFLLLILGKFGNAIDNVGCAAAENRDRRFS